VVESRVLVEAAACSAVAIATSVWSFNPDEVDSAGSFSGPRTIPVRVKRTILRTAGEHRKVIWVVLATVVIFAAGVVTGGLVVQQRTGPRAPSPGYFNRFESARRAVNSSSSALSNAPHRPNYSRQPGSHRRLFQILEPDIAEVFRQMRQNIRAELTPEQRRAFEERMQRWRERNAGRGNLRPGMRPKDSPGSGQRSQLPDSEGGATPGDR
jgi:hypothetical protein